MKKGNKEICNEMENTQSTIKRENNFEDTMLLRPWIKGHLGLV
jgi:hypothetical protein